MMLNFRSCKSKKKHKFQTFCPLPRVGLYVCVCDFENLYSYKEKITAQKLQGKNFWHFIKMLYNLFPFFFKLLFYVSEKSKYLRFVKKKEMKYYKLAKQKQTKNILMKIYFCNNFTPHKTQNQQTHQTDRPSTFSSTLSKTGTAK